MKPNEEFDKLFGEMKQVDRSSKARENSWLALKDRLNKPKRRKVFPAVISLALVAIASFLLITYLLPSETEQTSDTLSREEVIMGFLEKQYNGPDMEYERLLDEWMALQSETVVESQEDYDVLLNSEEYIALMDYFEASFGKYIRKDKFESFLSTNLLFQYQPQLLNNSLQMKLEKVTIKQDEDYPNIYRPIIDVSLTNNKGQQIFHTLREEFIFSETDPGKIGSYNGIHDGGGVELYDKFKNFDAYLTSGE